ncbi:MAG: rane protein-like protein [Thermoleophilia bacterium]|nr:rane protein-like protein [Thermoleophilia bacterium]
MTHRIRVAFGRLRSSARPLLQASIAAPVAWLIATAVFGHDQPIFAPISALVAIGATVAQPWQRAAEIVVGVTIGVGVADALTLVTGQGTWQIGLMVLLAMATSVLVGGGPLFVIQAGTAAVLVASLPSADGAASLDRVLDTLAGGGAALALTIVLLPVRPLRLAHRAIGPVVEELARTFEEVGAALRRVDPELAEGALSRARRTGEHWARLDEAIGIGRQAARIAPVRRHEEEELLDVAQCVVQLDYAIRDARVLARVAWRLTETDVPTGARLELAMVELATAVRALEGHIAGEYDATLLARTCAARATRIASSVSVGGDELTFTHFVGQVRSTSVDLLRASGLDRNDAISRMLDAVRDGRGELH